MRVTVQLLPPSLPRWSIGTRGGTITNKVRMGREPEQSLLLNDTAIFINHNHAP